MEERQRRISPRTYTARTRWSHGVMQVDDVRWNEAIVTRARLRDLLVFAYDQTIAPHAAPDAPPVTPFHAIVSVASFFGGQAFRNPATITLYYRADITYPFVWRGATGKYGNYTFTYESPDEVIVAIAAHEMRHLVQFFRPWTPAPPVVLDTILRLAPLKWTAMKREAQRSVRGPDDTLTLGDIWNAKMYEIDTQHHEFAVLKAFQGREDKRFAEGAVFHGMRRRADPTETQWRILGYTPFEKRDEFAMWLDEHASYLDAGVSRTLYWQGRPRTDIWRAHVTLDGLREARSFLKREWPGIFSVLPPIRPKPRFW
jgi:hypothetical protein